MRSAENEGVQCGTHPAKIVKEITSMAEIVPMDRPMVSLREAMDRLFSQSFTPTAGGPFGEYNRPNVPANIWEDAEGYHVWLLVPNVEAESIQVTAQSGVLSVAGEMRSDAPEQTKQLHQEWAPSRFERHMRLTTAIDSENATAAYKDGVLKVYVPKAAQSRPRTIKVNVES